MIHCIFNDPKDFAGDPPLTKQDAWNYAEMFCSGDLDYSTSTFPAYIEQIQNDDQNFFLQKTISYGDYLMIAFFIIFFVGFCLSGIRDFVKNRKLERL